MQQNLEQFSQAHDGEGNAQDLLRLLDAIDSDPSQRERSAVYHLIGDALRDPDSPSLKVDVTAAVMRSVAREPVPAVPADASVKPFRSSRLKDAYSARTDNPNTPSADSRHAAPWWSAIGRSAAAIAAVAFLSGLLWNGTGVSSDPVVAYVVFEQPRSAPQVVQMDSMPPELVDYLLAHRQNTVAGSMNAGSALIRANTGNAGEGGSGIDRPQHGIRAGDMEWVRLWDNRPVYVTPRAVER